MRVSQALRAAAHNTRLFFTAIARNTRDAFQTAFRNIGLFLAVPGRAIRNAFWHTIAACLHPGLYALRIHQQLAPTYHWLSQKWTNFKQWFWKTWVGKQCTRLGHGFNRYIAPILMPIWEHIIKPVVIFGDSYKSTAAVMLLAATILTSVAVPPAALIGVPIAVGIIAAFFERRHNNAMKKLARKQTLQIETLETQGEALHLVIKALTQDLSETKHLKQDVETLSQGLAEIRQQLLASPQQPPLRTDILSEPGASISTTPTSSSLKRSSSVPSLI